MNKVFVLVVFFSIGFDPHAMLYGMQREDENCTGTAAEKVFSAEQAEISL